MVTESAAALAQIRGHHRFDRRPELIRNHTCTRYRSIVTGQHVPIGETLPRRCSRTGGFRNCQENGRTSLGSPAGTGRSGLTVTEASSNTPGTARRSTPAGPRESTQSECRVIDRRGVWRSGGCPHGAEVSTLTAAAAAFCALTRDIPENSWGAAGLAQWDIRTLVGHTTMAVEAVSHCLTVAAKREDIPNAAAYYVAIQHFSQTAGADEFKTKLSRRAADDLGADPVATVEDIVRQALSDLQGTQDRLVGVLGGVLGIRLSSFIPTRILRACGAQPRFRTGDRNTAQLPADVITEAAMLATGIAVESGHGGVVLLSLTGRTSLAPGFSAL